MSTVVLVEQRPPLIIILASRVPVYLHVIISLLAVLVLRAFPSWAIARPTVREVARKRRSSSLTSNTSTLADPDEDINKQEKEKCYHITFSKVSFKRAGSSIKMAISRTKSMKPKLPRRLTLPARRFSSHIVTTLHNLTPHHHREDDADSYFSNMKATVRDMSKADIHPDVPIESSRKATPFKNVARRASIIFREIAHRS